MKWQKRLQTIEAVMNIWLEVQEKWTELEEVSDQHNITDVSKEKTGSVKLDPEELAFVKLNVRKLYV